MGKLFQELDEMFATDVVDDDLMVIEDVSSDTTKRIKWSELQKRIVIENENLGEGVVESHNIDFETLDGLGGYSTNEVATPYKWIDGKPIYKKTITFNSPTSNATISHGLSIQTPVKIEVIRSNDAIGAGFMHTTSSGIFFRFGTSDITVRNMGSLSSQPCLATLYYTKP